MRFARACGPLLVLALAACSGTVAGSNDGGTTSSGSGSSSGASGSSSGSSGQGAAPADAFVAADVVVSPAGACGLKSGTSFLALGTAVAGKPTTVEDGQPSGASLAHVSCSVARAGGGFDVALNASLDGGASLTITSPPGQGAVTLQGASGVTAVFQSAADGTYRESDCTLAFTYEGEAVPESPAIAAGRVWGHLSCEAAGDTQLGTQCDIETDFLFEQCGGQ